MKSVIPFLLLITFSINSFSQDSNSTVRFEYRTNWERWSLDITTPKTFEFVAFNPEKDFGLWINGNYSIADSSIFFVCDTSNKGVFTIQNDSAYRFNAQQIVKNTSFKTIEGYIIPKPTIYQQHNLSATIYGKYFTGDDMGNNIIELKKNNTYIIQDNSCLLAAIEKGRWILKDHFITFFPYKGGSSLLERTMKEKKIFFSNFFLIGKLRRDHYIAPTNSNIKETFIYFIKIAD